MSMRGLLLALLLALVAVGPAFAVDPLPFKDRAEEVRFQKLTGQLRCLVCQNESLADSNADLARDLRHEVFELMQKGQSDDEIKAYLVARYSKFVLYDPPLDGGTVLLWFGPLVILLLGAGVVIDQVRRRARAAAHSPAAAVAASNDTEDDW
jgi:cytochrome c-type biogenesis protein CcmH